MRTRIAMGIVFVTLVTVALGGGSGTPRKEDVPKYLEALKSSANAKERATAAEMLGKRGAIKASDVAQAIEPLKTALQKDKENAVRKAAAEALGTIGSDPTGVVPLLMDALKENNRDVKLGAIHGLALYGSDAKEAVPVLKEIANDKGEKTDKMKMMMSREAMMAIKSIMGKR